MDKEQLVPGGFEDVYASAILGADTLAGGDISSPREEDHFIGDSWAATEKDYPESFNHPYAIATRSIAQRDKLNTPEGKEIAEKFIRSQNLLELPDEAIRLAAGFEEGRRIFTANLMRSIKLIIQRSYALATNGKPPDFDELYASVTGETPQLIPHKDRQERLKAALAAVGLEGPDTAALAREWEHRSVIPVAEFLAQAEAVSQELLALSRDRLLRQIDFPVEDDPHLDNFAFDGITRRTVTNVGYTGSSVYRGGLSKNGRPLLAAVNTYNTDHPINEQDIRALYGHEIFPGHYLRAATGDLIHRNGKPGFERTIGTMCTSEVALEEGWAQVSLPLLYGGTREDVIETLGQDFAVHYALEDLQDAGKNNASIIHQLHGRPIEEAIRHFTDDLLLNPAIVKKLSGIWSRHPLVGPMYGPAYEKGRNAVEKALAKHGVLPVARVALHLNAPMELLGFKEKMAA